MLTQDDLQKIGSIINGKLDTKLFPIKKDIKSIKTKVKKMDIKIDKIERDLTATIAFFDKDQNNLHTRVDRIENHLQLTPIGQ